MASLPTSQIVAGVQGKTLPSNLDPMLMELLDKVQEKGNLIINMLGNGTNPQGTPDFNRFVSLISALEAVVMNSNNNPSKSSMPLTGVMGAISNITGSAPPQPVFDEKYMDDEITKWAADASGVRRLKTYQHLNLAYNLRMTTIDHEISEEIKRIKGQN